MKDRLSSFFFFFNDTATTEIYTLSLHDALPICSCRWTSRQRTSTSSASGSASTIPCRSSTHASSPVRSEEHTSELQSQSNLVCRLLLEKKKTRLITLLSLIRRPHSRT